MAYEREAIVETSSSQPTPHYSVAQMREERVVDPYRGPKLALALQTVAEKSQIGQQDISRESARPVESGPPEETVKLSPQVAALARREQKFRQQQHQLELDRKTLAAEKAEVEAFRAAKQKIAQKDYSGLDDLGIDYNEYSQHALNKLNGLDPVQEELKRVNGKLTEVEKTIEENISKQFDAAVQERRLAAAELINTSTEFPRIKKAKAHEVVVQHILDTWENDSKEITVAQAAKEVEEILLEKAKKWAKLLEDEKQADAKELVKALPPLKPALRTLTNQVTAGDPKRLQKPLHTLNDADRYAEARRRAEEKLRAGQA